MKELRDKERFRRMIYSIPSLIFLAIISFVLARGAIRVVIKEEGSRSRVEALKQQANTMMLREQVLEKNIAHLKTSEGVEDEIRDKFSAVPDGEHVAIIINNKRSATSTEDNTLSWYERILNVIMSK